MSHVLPAGDLGIMGKSGDICNVILDVLLCFLGVKTPKTSTDGSTDHLNGNSCGLETLFSHKK